MKAVVMAGGEGSRLRPLTSERPKPLVPVVGRPIMEHILVLLGRHNFRDVVATIQYLGSHIRNYFGDGSELGVNLAYSVEETPLGTAGSVKQAQSLLTEPFLVISGDALTDVDLSAAVSFHRQRRALATIVLKPVPNPLEYGVVVVDEEGRVQRFLEKPSWGEVISDLANTGIYVLDPAIFDWFPPDQVSDWSGDVFPRLLREGEPLYGWIADGYWEDVGSHGAYVKANFDCLEGKVAVEMPARRLPSGLWVHEEADVSSEARIDGPVLVCAGASVRAGAWLNGPVVVGPYSTVDLGAKVSNSVIWDHSYVGDSARLRGAVVCRSVTVKRGSLLEEGSVIGSNGVIGAGAIVQANVRIWPNKEIEAGAEVHESVIWAGSWKRGLFTAYGLTGLANIEITPEFAGRLGAAVAALHPKQTTIAVARDFTRSARMIHRAMISGLTSAGANVVDLSALPLPVIRHWARRHRSPAVHVQSSPVDPRSVDIRLFDQQGLDLDRQTERKLENLYFREDIRRVGHFEIGQISRREDANEHYASELLDKLDLESARSAPVKLLVDYSNGAAAQVLPHVLQEMNCSVIPLNASPAEVVLEQDDGAFRARLEEIGTIVVAVGARLGVFIDSPGERLVLIDEGGEVLDASTSFAIFAQLSLIGRPGLLVGPASASLAFSLIAEQLESRFVPTKITPGAVLRAAQHAETVLASDAEGGYCWPEFIISFDAIYSTAKLVELLATSPAGLSELRANVPAVGHEKRIVPCPWEAKGRVMRTVIEGHLQDRVDLTDGVKVFVEGGWVLVVPDADKPEYQVVASTRDPVQARRRADEYAELVQGIVAGVRTEVASVAERE